MTFAGGDIVAASSSSLSLINPNYARGATIIAGGSTVGNSAFGYTILGDYSWGLGGSGAAGAASGTAYNGGNGWRGGGGGGGGGCANGIATGASGGNGGNGYCLITCYG